MTKWLAPYHKDYRDGRILCRECYRACLASCDDVQTLAFRSGSAAPRGELIRGFRTVKKLGRVEYDGEDCDEPAKVEERLQLYAVQLGGNAFVEYYWERRQERRRARGLLATRTAVIQVEPYVKQQVPLETYCRTALAPDAVAECAARSTKT